MKGIQSIADDEEMLHFIDRNTSDEVLGLLVFSCVEGTDVQGDGVELDFPCSLQSLNKISLLIVEVDLSSQWRIEVCLRIYGFGFLGSRNSQFRGVEEGVVEPLPNSPVSDLRHFSGCRHVSLVILVFNVKGSLHGRHRYSRKVV